MRWKFLTFIFLIFNLSWAVSLTELLDTTQHEITKYESQGLANVYPYQYTKLTEYYRYGKLYSSYLLIKQAERMLNLALHSVNPLGKAPTNYFLNYLEAHYYFKVRQEQPITLAKVETSFNAYMDLLLASFTGKEDYKTLEYQIKDNFLQNWKNFLKSSPKPIFFLIPKNLNRPQDIQFMKLLSFSSKCCWVKKIIIETDNETLNKLRDKGLLPPKAKVNLIKDERYIHCLIY